MNWSMAQLVLGARNPDGDGWMQLVVFLILGVFWAVGGILKARAEKERQRKQQQGGSVRPARAPQGSAVRSMIRGLKPKLGVKPPQQGMQPRQSEAIRGVSPSPVVRGQQIMRPVAQERPLVRPKAARPAGAQIKQVTAQAVKAVPKAAEPKETATSMELSKPEVSLDSIEQLRAAIVHYEIFGKCVSSREPREQIWMR